MKKRKKKKIRRKINITLPLLYLSLYQFHHKISFRVFFSFFLNGGRWPRQQPYKGVIIVMQFIQGRKLKSEKWLGQGQTAGKCGNRDFNSSSGNPKTFTLGHYLKGPQVNIITSRVCAWLELGWFTQGREDLEEIWYSLQIFERVSRGKRISPVFVAPENGAGIGGVWLQKSRFPSSHLSVAIYPENHRWEVWPLSLTRKEFKTRLHWRGLLPWEWSWRRTRWTFRFYICRY